jgi:membrane-bound lytic murein transglycosylase B
VVRRRICPLSAVVCSLVVLVLAFPAFAAPCRSGSFETWLERFKQEAAARGISQRMIAIVRRSPPMSALSPKAGK